MSSNFGGGPFPDWQEIQRWLGKEFPRKMAGQWDNNEDGEWLDRLMKALLSWDNPQQTARGSKTKTEEPGGDWLKRLLKALLQPEPVLIKAETKSMFSMDTAKDAKRLTVTLQLPNDTNMRRLQVFATSDMLRVTGLPDNRTHTVRFPCRVYPRSGRAKMDGVRMVVTFRRRPPDKTEVELFIRE